MRAHNKHALDHWGGEPEEVERDERRKGGWIMPSRMKSDSTRSDWTAADRRGASLQGLLKTLGTPIGTVSIDGGGRW